ncbi:MAG: glycosyltransferase family 2 protein [Pseudomonadota bacterium]
MDDTNKQQDITELRVAAIIPCFNEAACIGQVVADLKAALPSAEVYVYDNNSTDATIDSARRAGAIVRTESRQGKGFVVRRMFADIEADTYVMIDGDNTYEAAVADKLVNKLLDENLDMVTGARVEHQAGAYRPGHKFGNWMLTGLVKQLFGDDFDDMLSGYRVFSRRFVKSFPQTSSGFEIETELTIHALELRMPVADVPTAFQDRPAGDESKLRTFADGFRILFTISNLLKQEQPLRTFSFIGLLLLVLATILGIPIVTTFVETGLVPRFPTAILATGISIIAFLSFTCGLILDTVTRGRTEAKRMRYLDVPSMQAIIEARRAAAAD